MSNRDDTVDDRDVFDEWRRFEVSHQGDNMTNTCRAVKIGNKKRCAQKRRWGVEDWIVCHDGQGKLGTQSMELKQEQLG